MIEYKNGPELIDWDSLVELYFATDLVIGLGKEKDLIKIKKAFLNSYKIVTAWEMDRIIGAGRMISDGICYGWIHDMGVLPEYQKQGVGKRIMEELLDGNENLLIGLTAAFGAEEFYYKLGFKKHKTALAKYPGESIYLEY
jgi:GNAT superfamily N-acetyltransferase